jgi:hypothetical protein
MNYHDLDNFTAAYIECALWSSTDDEGEPLDALYDYQDFSPETIAQMIEDCKAFQQSNRELIDSADYGSRASKDEYAGHDFWLTRNRHGAGFWDRNLGKIGERLTESAHAYGEINLYIGDDGKIYSI